VWTRRSFRAGHVGRVSGHQFLRTPLPDRASSPASRRCRCRSCYQPLRTPDDAQDANPTGATSSTSPLWSPCVARFHDGSRWGWGYENVTRVTPRYMPSTSFDDPEAEITSNGCAPSPSASLGRGDSRGATFGVPSLLADMYGNSVRLVRRSRADRPFRLRRRMADDPPAVAPRPSLRRHACGFAPPWSPSSFPRLWASFFSLASWGFPRADHQSSCRSFSYLPDALGVDTGRRVCRSVLGLGRPSRGFRRSSASPAPAGTYPRTSASENRCPTWCLDRPWPHSPPRARDSCSAPKHHDRDR